MEPCHSPGTSPARSAPPSPRTYRPAVYRRSLWALPAEVLVIIFENLSFGEHKALAATCRFFWQLLSDPAFKELNTRRFLFKIRAGHRIVPRISMSTDVIRLDKVSNAEQLLDGVTSCYVLSARHVVCHVVRNYQVNWMMQWLPKCENLETLDVAGTVMSLCLFYILFFY